MRQLNEHHSFTGMQRDLSVTKHPANFLYNARNIRLTSRGDNTLLAITNEKGTTDTEIPMSGNKYLGHCKIGKYLVIFSTTPAYTTNDLTLGTTSYPKVDYIDRIDLSNITKETLYSGNLRFNVDYPIKALSSYENEDIQKVYWTDGYNHLRLINIVSTDIISTDADDQFEFTRTLTLSEEVEIEKQLGNGGMFPSGVIQYAFTYYTKYGPETNIFYTSALLPISPKDRGASPEEKVENTFKITIKNVDTRFDYLRIYSIIRTSLNGTPIVKRIQDINVKNLSARAGASPEVFDAFFIDNGTTGDVIDPYELLYKGGESIIAKTIEYKDGTLFFGNIQLKNEDIRNTLLTSDVSFITSYRQFIPSKISTEYANQLTAFEYRNSQVTNKSVPCAGFKYGNYYRCGIQLQYKTGKWSDPIFIDDVKVNLKPSYTEGNNNDADIVEVPIIRGRLLKSIADDLLTAGYKKIRGVVVYPEYADRLVKCQGIGCVAMGTRDSSYQTRLVQSSWFFRPQLKSGTSNIGPRGTVSPFSNIFGHLPYMNVTYAEGGYDFASRYTPYDIRLVEIQGHFGAIDSIDIEPYYCTLNSPDIEFNDDFENAQFTGVSIQDVGKASFRGTISTIKLETETPTIASDANGLLEKVYMEGLSYGIVAGPFYEDWIVDDNRDNDFEKWSFMHNPVKWMVYPWQRNGSLNNDIDRPTGKGTRSAVLKKKVIANRRYSKTIWNTTSTDIEINNIQLFSSNELSVIKLGGTFYQGNIDTLLNPSKAAGLYFGYGTASTDTPANENSDDSNPSLTSNSEVETSITNPYWYMTFYKQEAGGSEYYFGVYRWKRGTVNGTQETNWFYILGDVGDKYRGLAKGKSPVRMKYKSTKHLVINTHYGFPYETFTDSNLDSNEDLSILPIMEVSVNDSASYRSTKFGGLSDDALKSNIWIPCGEPVRLDSEPVNIGTVAKPNNVILFDYSWGDTYYQRWECLKTYPFTNEDPNQIIEIGSFMLETYVNIDGRYDRNRGQYLNVSPQNFNLMNLVYSQLNNFFTYRILDDSFYQLNKYPNQIMWSKEKKAGEEVDTWTNITLSSTYDLDGTKGEIQSINVWQDKLFCFQDKGVSMILFNSRVQIPASDGIPIEISNNYKVDGVRYLSDGIGCLDQFLIKGTPSGIYFIDSISKHLYHLGEGIQDVTTTHNMASWFEGGNNVIKKLLYDEIHKDLYITCNHPEEIDSSAVSYPIGDEALCFSEILGQFTSFMDYPDLKILESYKDDTFALSDKIFNEETHLNHLHYMFKGPYNELFGNQVGWELSFISNGLDSGAQDMDKIFSNIDFRLDMYDYSAATPYQAKASLDYIQVENEYQNTGEVSLTQSRIFSRAIQSNNYNSHDANLKKKFQIWRIQIPRNSGSIDRIRNTWCKITLGCKGSTGTLSEPIINSKKAILQDLNVQYYA